MSIVDNKELLKLQFKQGMFFTEKGEAPVPLGEETAKLLLDDIERGETEEFTLD